MSRGIYLCYREILNPTVIDQASFFNCQESEYLITASVNVLNIYRIETTLNTQEDGSSDNENGYKLVHVFRECCFGRVKDLTVFRKPRNDRDSILIAFDDAKLVIIEFNPILQSIQLINLFTIEDNAIGFGASTQIPFRYKTSGAGLLGMPKLSIENSNMLASAIIYGHYLLFLSLCDIKSGVSPALDMVMDHFVVDLNHSLQLHGELLDAKFVSGYTRPTIAVLIESLVVPIGHVAKVRYTNALVVLSVDVVSKSLSVLWKHSNMPHDSFQIYPTIQPKGHLKSSILVVSMNAVLLVNDSKVTGVALNAFAAGTVHPLHKLSPCDTSQGFELDGSAWSYFNPNIFLASLKDGTVLRLRITSTSLGQNLKLEVSMAGESVAASCCCASLAGKLWFLGSRLYDSIVLKVDLVPRMVYPNSTNVTPFKRGSDDALGILANPSSTMTPTITPSNKRQKKSSKVQSVLDLNGLSNAEASQILSRIESEEQGLYGTSLDVENSINSERTYENSSSNHDVNVILTVMDMIPTIPAIQSTSFVGNNDIFDQITDIQWRSVSDTSDDPTNKRYSRSNPSSNILKHEAKDSLVFSAGVNSSAGLYRYSSGLRLSKVACKGQLGVVAINTLTSCKLPYVMLFQSYVASTKIYLMKHNPSINSSPTTSILESKEITSYQAACITTSPTISVGIIHNLICVQVFDSGLRLFRVPESISDDIFECEPLQDMLLHETEEMGGLAADLNDIIVEATIIDGFVSFVTKLHHLYVLEYDKREEMLQVKFKRVHQMDAKNESMMNEEDDDHVPWTILPASISSYSGCLYVDNAGNMEIKSLNASSPLTPCDLEELYLYNEKLSDNSAITNESNHMGDDSMSLNQSHQQQIVSMDRSKSSYLLVVDNHDVIYLFQINNQHMKMIIQIINIGDKADTIDLSETKEQSIGNQSPKQQSRVLSAILANLDPNSSLSQQSMCLVVVLSTGDLLVYRGVYSHEKLVKLVKIRHTHQLHSRSVASMIFKHPHAATSSFISPWNQSKQYAKLSSCTNIDGTSRIFVSGQNPAVIALSDNCLPIISSYNFPEMPYAYNGFYMITNMSIMNSIQGIISLWMELSDEKLMDRPSILGLYQEAISVINIASNESNKGVSMNKINTNNVTFHKLIEVTTNSIEDVTEMKLLDQSTCLAVCSQDIPVPFRSEVLTETEQGRIEADFAHYFSNLTSWFQPNDSNGMNEIITSLLSDENVSSSDMIALKNITNNGNSLGHLSSILSIPAPILHDREYKLALLQDGIVIDEYFLNEDERILDMEVMKLAADIVQSTTDRKRNTSNIIMKTPKKTMILVGTCIADKHGEDSPSDGRLLLFGLDYIRITSSISEADGPSMKKSDIFQPKLKLLSSHVGPASIVRQFGNNRVLSTVGPCIVVYKLEMDPMGAKDNVNLVQISFYYAKFYITTVTIVKNYLFIADGGERIELLVWRDEDWSLTLVSKDYTPQMISRAICAINDGQSLAVIAGDAEANVQVLQFDPK